MRQSEPSSHLNTFFALFQNHPGTADIKADHAACLNGPRIREAPSNTLSLLTFVYERAIRTTEKEAAATGYRTDLLGLQRSLYHELESLLADAPDDKRHHFLIVIPVADRPAMLNTCLESLREQCRTFHYGGFVMNAAGIPVFNKIRVMIIDDSREPANILRIKEICSQSTAAGVPTSYVGLDEQTTLLKQIPGEYWGQLQDLLGRVRDPVPAHKGASITRNIAYLWLHACTGTFSEKTLIYFLDSDEEFRVKVKGGTGIADISFINYFYKLDRLFTDEDVEVATGKVVGDPPVSPTVMINTLLDDLLLYVETIAASFPDEQCIFHRDQSDGDCRAEYHDMPHLFGYAAPAGPRRYRCGLGGGHTVRESLDDVSKKALGFFYGHHATRMQFYQYEDDDSGTEGARTVYTGNYVFTRAGLRHFIPFAGLKLRMAGPALGRILRNRLKERFVSVNLPVLHKRTIGTTCGNEFRSGISDGENLIDISQEFMSQFWGDVMLFTVERLAELGYPDRISGLSEIAGIAHDVQERLWNLYAERQDAIEAKTARVEQYLHDSRFWWHEDRGAKPAIQNLACFCSQVKNNFGRNSSSMEGISGQIQEETYMRSIITAIHAFHETDIAWNSLLASTRPAPPDDRSPSSRC